MTVGRQIRTPRLLLRPVSWSDLGYMKQLKTNAASFGRMYGGVKNFQQIEDEMAEDLSFWAKRGLGIFVIYEEGQFVGMTGFHERDDDRGIALRFSLLPDASGRGLAREAAGAALRFALNAGEPRLIGVTRDDNLAARIVLGSIGMSYERSFWRSGYEMLIYAINQRPVR